MPIEFDGVDDKIDFGSPSALDNLGPLTFSAWGFVTGHGGTNDTGRFFDKHAGGSAGPLFATSGNLSRTRSLDFLLVTGGTWLERVSSDFAFEFSKWHHFVVTWDGTLTATGIHIYVDAIETSYQVTQDGSGATDDSANNFFIGGRHDSNRSFDGHLAECAMWNVVLSAGGIALLSNAGRRSRIPLQIKPANLVIHPPLDDEEDGVSVTGANAVKDRGPNALHGTPSNSPVGRGAFPWL